LRAEVQLTPQAIERIAQRVAQLLRNEPPERAEASDPEARLLSASEFARYLGVTRPWAYEHAVELGAHRLGHRPRARLRFDLEEASAAGVCSRGARSIGDEVEPAAAPPPRRLRRPRRPSPPGSVLAIRRAGGVGEQGCLLSGGLEVLAQRCANDRRGCLMVVSGALDESLSQLGL
jgi:hypothetical protein